MKLLCTFLCLSLIIGFIGCTSITVKSDYDREVNFAKYKTYKWMPAPQKRGPRGIAPNSLLDKRIKRAVEGELNAKGYQQIMVGKPDILLTYHTAVRQKVDVSAVDYGYWRGRYRGRTVTTYRYKEGTLILDFVDPKMKQLVWRGWAIGVVGNREEAEEKINKSVKKILDKFPPQ